MKFSLQKLSVIALGLALIVPAPRVLHAQAASGEAARATAGEKTTPDATVPEKKAEEQDENDAYRHSPTVVKLGALLHLNPEQAATLFTVINFLVLAVAVGAFLAKALPKTFRNRSSKIQKQLVDARTATEEASARLSGVEDRLAKLDDQIAAMRTQSEADSARVQQRMHDSLEDEKAKILAAAEQEIASATTLAQRQIQQYAAELAIEHAARKLIVTAETDRLLVESFAHRLGSDNGGQN